jgi:hypothetical protein
MNTDQQKRQNENGDRAAAHEARCRFIRPLARHGRFRFVSAFDLCSSVFIRGYLSFGHVGF